MATGKVNHLSALGTFGCRIWVHPPGHHQAKLPPNLQKGVFLGCWTEHGIRVKEFGDVDNVVTFQTKGSRSYLRVYRLGYVFRLVE